MRTGLITIGTVLLVLGAVFFYLPTATTTAMNMESGQSPWTGYAAATLPIQLSIALLLIGFLLLIFGFIIPSHQTQVVVNSPAKRVEKTMVYEHTEGTRKPSRTSRAKITRA